MANEKRLIPESERSDLIRCLKKIHNSDFTPGVYEHSVYGRAALFLEETADSVEVVRCKDCKYFRKGKPFRHECKKVGGGIFYPNSDDFCSYGERRTDGQRDMC